MATLFSIGLERWLLWLVLGLVGGYTFNQLTAWQEEHYPGVPRSVMVIVGTILTLAVSALVIPLIFVILAGITFACTGVAMTAGDIIRRQKHADLKWQRLMEAERKAGSCEIEAAVAERIEALRIQNANLNA